MHRLYHQHSSTRQHSCRIHIARLKTVCFSCHYPERGGRSPNEQVSTGPEWSPPGVWTGPQWLPPGEEVGVHVWCRGRGGEIPYHVAYPMMHLMLPTSPLVSRMTDGQISVKILPSATSFAFSNKASLAFQVTCHCSEVGGLSDFFRFRKRPQTMYGSKADFIRKTISSRWDQFNLSLPLSTAVHYL